MRGMGDGGALSLQGFPETASVLKDFADRLQPRPDVLKALPITAFVYLILPRDIIFDYRFLGAFDDMLVVTLLLSIFISKATPYVTAEEKEKADAIDVEFRVLMQQERGDAGDAADAPGVHDDDGTPHDDLRKH